MSAMRQIDRGRVTALVSLLLLSFALSDLQAQPLSDDAITIDAVEVIGTRRPLSTFPGAITLVDGETLRQAQRRVSLAESLAQVPGVTVLDRQNYAQDLQIQSRGFGARSSFGIRGIKLIIDGIPASAADGQGQAASYPLDALDRIEVLRGPLALQYGNAAGGVIVGYTDLEKKRGKSFDLWGAEQGTHRVAAGFDGASDNDSLRWRVNANRFSSDGERMHSEVQRSQLNAIAQWRPREGERIRLVLNSLSQPDTQDPLGLTRQALRTNPNGTDAAALIFNTRKSIENHQVGLQWDNKYASGRRAWLGFHYIERDILQFLALPVGAQIPASSAGGVIDLGRRSNGIAAGHQWSGARGAFMLGFEAGHLQEARSGYENFLGNQVGVRGRLRRDEANRVSNREIYAIGDWNPAKGWSMLSAVRHSHINFKSDDQYFANGNGNDSGQLSFKESSLSFGVTRAFANGEIFASLGRGFETPTVTELAYRPDGGAGFNFGLTPAHFISGEIGARWRHEGMQASLALYRVNGADEIVPADSRGGRASFANAGRTGRAGMELGWSGQFGKAWSYALTANWIDARFDESFNFRVFANGASVIRVVESGNRVPGIPKADAYAEMRWRSPNDRFSSAVEARISDSIATDDRNTDFSGGYARFALRMEWRPSQAHGWNGFIRVDNIFNRHYVGSVIVNEGNGRYFEPGAGRGFTIGVGWNENAEG